MEESAGDETEETSPYDMDIILEIQQLSERHLTLMDEIFRGIQRKLELETIPCKCGCGMTMFRCYSEKEGVDYGTAPVETDLKSRFVAEDWERRNTVLEAKDGALAFAERVKLRRLVCGGSGAES